MHGYKQTYIFITTLSCQYYTSVLLQVECSNLYSVDIASRDTIFGTIVWDRNPENCNLCGLEFVQLLIPFHSNASIMVATHAFIQVPLQGIHCTCVEATPPPKPRVPVPHPTPHHPLPLRYAAVRRAPPRRPHRLAASALIHIVFCQVVFLPFSGTEPRSCLAA